MSIQRELFFFDVGKKENERTLADDLPLITNEEAVLESVKNIIMTKPGERVMNPNFGVNLDRFLFQPLDLWYAGQIADEIKSGILRSEPRVSEVVVEIDVNYDDLLYDVRVNFTIASTAREYELNFKLDQIR